MNAVRFLEAVATANSSGINPIQASHQNPKFGNARMSRIADPAAIAASHRDGILSRMNVRTSGRCAATGAVAASVSPMRRSLAKFRVQPLGCDVTKRGKLKLELRTSVFWNGSLTFEVA